MKLFDSKILRSLCREMHKVQYIAFPSYLSHGNVSRHTFRTDDPGNGNFRSLTLTSDSVSRAGGTPGWLLNLGTGTWSFPWSHPGGFCLPHQIVSSLYGLGHGTAWHDGHAAALLPATSRRLGFQHRVGPYPPKWPGHCNHPGRRPDR